MKLFLTKNNLKIFRCSTLHCPTRLFHHVKCYRIFCRFVGILILVIFIVFVVVTIKHEGFRLVAGISGCDKFLIAYIYTTFFRGIELKLTHNHFDLIFLVELRELRGFFHLLEKSLRKYIKSYPNRNVLFFIFLILIIRFLRLIFELFYFYARPRALLDLILEGFLWRMKQTRFLEGIVHLILFNIIGN